MKNSSKVLLRAGVKGKVESELVFAAGFQQPLLKLGLDDFIMSVIQIFTPVIGIDFFCLGMIITYLCTKNRDHDFNNLFEY